MKSNLKICKCKVFFQYQANWICCSFINVPWRKRPALTLFTNTRVVTASLLIMAKHINIFFVRATEHIVVPNFTGKSLEIVKKSAVSDHLLECNCSTDFEHFEHTCISAKFDNKVILNRIRPFIDPLLCKERSTLSQKLTIRRKTEDIKEKNLSAIIIFINFLQGIWHYWQMCKMFDVLRAYGIPKKVLKAIAIMYDKMIDLIDNSQGSITWQ